MTAGIVVVGLLCAGAFVWVRLQGGGCTRRGVAIDGTVPPGGPQTAQAAVDEYLSSQEVAPFLTSSDPADFKRSEGNGTRVVFSSDDDQLVAEKLENGWIIGQVQATC